MTFKSFFLYLKGSPKSSGSSQNQKTKKQVNTQIILLNTVKGKKDVKMASTSEGTSCCFMQSLIREGLRRQANDVEV